MKNKVARKDFSEANMPHNRKEVFKDLLINRTSTLFSLGLMMLLFALPLIAAIIFSNLSISSFDLTDIENNQELYNKFLLNLNSNNLLILIGLIILSFGCAGTYKIIRLLIWQEGIFFYSDFFKGIKSNWKGFSLTFTIIGMINFVSQYLFYNVNINEYPFVACVIVIAFFLPCVLFILGQTTIYNMPYLHKLKNSFLLSWRNWYTSIPVVLLNSLFVIIPLLISNVLAYIILIIVIPLIIAPLLVLFNTLYTDTIFDKYINKDNFKEIYDKGIYRNG